MATYMPDRVPAKCLACGKLFRLAVHHATCPHCGSPSLVQLCFLSTSALLTVILTVLSWELELLVLGAKFLAGQKIDQLGHAVLLTASAVMTVFASMKGKSEIARIRKFGGPPAITWFQGFLVALVIVSFASLLVWFISWQEGRP